MITLWFESLPWGVFTVTSRGEVVTNETRWTGLYKSWFNDLTSSFFSFSSLPCLFSFSLFSRLLKNSLYITISFRPDLVVHRQLGFLLKTRRFGRGCPTRFGGWVMDGVSTVSTSIYFLVLSSYLVTSLSWLEGPMNWNFKWGTSRSQDRGYDGLGVVGKGRGFVIDENVKEDTGRTERYQRTDVVVLLEDLCSV